MMMKSEAFEIEIIPYQATYFKNLIDLFEQNCPKYFAREELEGFIKYLNEEIEDYSVIQADNKVVGCGGINYDQEKNTGIISWDMLSPSYQRIGIGSKLLQFRIEKLKNTPSITHIIVRTSQHTYPYYEKNGFVITKVIKDYWAHGFDLYQMEYHHFNN